MFLSRNKKKNNVYPCKSQFYYIKLGFKGINIIWARFFLCCGLNLRWRHMFVGMFSDAETQMSLTSSWRGEKLLIISGDDFQDL